MGQKISRGRQETSETSLLLACQQNNYKAVQKILKQQSLEDAKEVNDEGRNALHIAVQYSSLKVVELLLRHDPTLSDSRDIDNWTPLHVAAACENDNKALISLLIKGGCDVNAETILGENALQVACYNNNLKVVKELLNHMGPRDILDGRAPLNSAIGNIEILKTLVEHIPQCIHSTDNEGFTALHMAAHQSDDVQIIRLLIKNGSDIRAKTSDGNTALHLACQMANVNVIKELLLHLKEDDLLLEDSKGRTVLQKSAQEAYTDILKIVLHHRNGESNSKLGSLSRLTFRKLRRYINMPLLIAEDVDKRNVFHYAVRSLFTDTTEYLLKICRECQAHANILEAQDINGETPLLYALSSRVNLSQFLCLYRNNAQFSVKNDFHQNIFHLITRRAIISDEDDFSDLLNALTEISEKDETLVNAKDKSSMTPFFLAVHRGRENIVRYFLENHRSSIDINGGCDGTTPLITATRTKFFQLSKMLIEHGANLNIEGKDGLSAIDFIYLWDNSDLKKMLPVDFSSMYDFPDDLISTSEYPFKELSQRYPIWNDEEDDWIQMFANEKPISSGYLFLDRAKKYILGPLHLNPDAIADLQSTKAQTKGLAGLKLQNFHCPDSEEDWKHKKLDRCNVLRALFQFFDAVETNISANFTFEVKMTPIGSTIEGTRVGLANEADLCMTFEELQDVFYLDENAMVIYVFEEKITEKLKQFCYKKGEKFVFDYTKFFKSLIVSVDVAISKAVDDNLKAEELKIVLNRDYVYDCTECVMRNEKFIAEVGAFTHCTSCKPAVTIKKMGININLQWKCQNGKLMNITVDMIPTIPFSSVSPLELQRKVISTMKTERPIGFRKHLKKFVERDLIFVDKYKENSVKTTCSASIKRLNYYNEDDYVINPIQFINISKLTGFSLEIYKKLKLLKDICNSDLKSYSAKRLVLRDEFRDMSIGVKYADSQRNEEMKNTHINEAVKSLITSYNPELRDYFSSLHEKLCPKQDMKLDFDMWQTASEGIPLCKK